MGPEHTQEATVALSTSEPAPAAVPRELISQSTHGTDEEPPPGAIRKRHAAFVGALGLVSAALWIGVPVAVRHAVVRCEGVRCLSLEAGLKRALNTAASPCHDFYQHVCGRWTQTEHFFEGPLQKYDSYQDAEFLREAIFLEDKGRFSHLKHSGVRYKMSKLLVKCRSQESDERSMTKILEKLRLPWPTKAPSTELEMLDIMVGASLEYSLPLLWTFAVGRHPRKNRQNAVYVLLDGTTSIWFRHVRAMYKRKRIFNFLRRCAENIGGKGQSYDSMIRHLLVTHAEIERALKYNFEINQPEFMNFSDVTLRVAVNRHLPDESQQWPGDEMVCMQRAVFISFRQRHLADASKAAAFKSYAGAYLVWYLAPYTSPYLTHSLMAELGVAGQEWDFVRRRCSSLVQNTLTLAFWKARQDKVHRLEKTVAFEAYTALRSILQTFVAQYDDAVAEHMSDFIETLSLNVYNMSLGWDVLERIYRPMPAVNGMFMDMYKTLETYKSALLRRSIRRPNSSYVYVPQLFEVRPYRLLAAREIYVPITNQLWPLFDVRYPLPVLMASFGWQAARGLVEMIYYTYFVDGNLKKIAGEQNTFPAPLRLAITQFQEDLRGAIRRSENATLPDAELDSATTEAIALLLAYKASKGPLRNRTYRNPEGERNRAGTTVWESDDQHVYFEDFPAERLFFLVSCFRQCNYKPGMRQRLHCNQLLPRLPDFDVVFGCKAGDRMFVGNNQLWKQRAAIEMCRNNGSSCDT
ncbi:uncharacterized protein LOC142573127 [Dermacentor variabilis]|uniref:uncharacterized protein LOC142573127 n=1 Tax=Dermacentor variabilis TaxID=34621 RepID=UPI003F5BFBE4